MNKIHEILMPAAQRSRGADDEDDAAKVTQINRTMCLCIRRLCY